MRGERFTVPAEAAGERVDRLLAAHLGLARNQVQRWLDEGRVRVAGATARSSAKVAAGDTVEWDAPPPPRDPRLEPETGELRLLFEDSELIVVDKPPGLAVHPGAGRSTGTLAHRLLAHFPELAGVGGPGRPGIVHRLDRDTSGVMVVARTSSAYQRLHKAFAARAVEKRYVAVAHGLIAEAQTVDAPIGRHPSRRQEMAVRPAGRPATSVVRPLATLPFASLLEVELLTGRTHQIRVHLKSIGHPLVGDPVYGEARWKAAPARSRALLRDFPRPALHAWRLGFEHPAGSGLVSVEAPVPEDLRELWRGLAGADPAELLGAGGLSPR
jgi:23S rRNA pseudouridine1911/1915/1917 synthase